MIAAGESIDLPLTLLWKSLALGAAIGVLSLAVRVLILMAGGENTGPPQFHTPDWGSAYYLFVYVIGGAILLGPLLETLIFPLVEAARERVNASQATLVFAAAAVALLAWLVHGAALASVTQAGGFASIYLWYVRVRKVRGSPAAAFLAAYVAHVAWNATVAGPKLVTSLLAL